MAKGVKMKKYARRTSMSKPRLHILPIITYVLVLSLLCFAVSVLVGLSLGRRAEEYQKSQRFDFPADPYYSGDKTVKPVDAYIFPQGADMHAYAARGITDLSVCLCDSEGSLSYTSELGGLDGFITNAENRSLAEQVEYIHEWDGYICAYFYVRSFQIEDSTLRELYKSYELALIREAALAGVDDIMLIGIPIDDSTVAEAEQYVSRACLTAEDTVIGVLVAPELMSLTEQHIYHASRIREACDYIALDFRSLSPDADLVKEVDSETAEEEKSNLVIALEQMEYYIKSYSMRIVLSKDNSTLYDSMKNLGVKNMQIIGDLIS